MEQRDLRAAPAGPRQPQGPVLLVTLLAWGRQARTGVPKRSMTAVSVAASTAGDHSDSIIGSVFCLNLIILS